MGISYFLGSLPFGWLLGRLAGQDIRRAGSRNIGATNVLRLCGWRYGIAALLLDAAKGAAAALLVAKTWLPSAGGPLPSADWLPPALCGAMAVLGHTFPIWFWFKGGKGVATGAGVVGVLMPWPLAAGLAVFLAVAAFTRYISLGSMSGAAAIALTATLLAAWAPTDAHAVPWPLAIFAWLLAVLIVWLHRANIDRLRRGTESRFGKN